MAYIHQYSKTGDKKLIRHISILGGIGLFLAVFMAWTSDNLLEEWKFIASVSGFFIIVFMFISYRTNPLGWFKLFYNKKFREIQAMSAKVSSVLERLDDRCFVFNWIIMEFFQIDHFIITPNGIFIVAAFESGDFSINEHNILVNDGKLIDKTTGKLWRVCNMLNILYKKGFKQDHMPIPVIVATEASRVSLKEYKGISILPCEELDTFIKSKKECIDEKMVKGFSWFITERYVLKEVSAAPGEVKEKKKFRKKKSDK